jgi:cephalosporin-C deacetylase-like acetyl esterase
MKFHSLFVLAFSLLGFGAAVSGSETANDYLDFIKAQAADLRSRDRAPQNLEEWRSRKTALRIDLLKAWGGFPERPAPLEPRKIAELQREGYRIEKIVFQTLPGVWMTANAYVPNRRGKLPALLMVHGHWRGAKQDPVVQSRCIGAVKLGFFVLVVDAFGAGERGVGRALGEYHGDMTAATLLPIGLPLSGLQVYENTRAVDYLQQRPEVDPQRIGVTGASGGGNQSMYAGAWEERLAAAAPVCSVGNYQAYLGAACCMCEVVPGALRFTEEWAVLGMVAPRGLMVINATKDSHQFSVDEAKKSLEVGRSVFEAFGKRQNLRHTIFESGHDYSQPMREAVYGWMSLHLKHEGDGSPVPEPAVTPEDPETLRCFPDESRPADWMTIPKFASMKGRELLASKKSPTSAEDWRQEQKRLKGDLIKLLGGFSKSGPLNVKIGATGDNKIREITFNPEPGITLAAMQRSGDANKPLSIVLDLDGADKAAASEAAKELAASGSSVITLDLRATGKLAWPNDKVGRAPDHTTAEWALWIGRPLIGQWVCDLQRLLDSLQEADGKISKEVHLIGIGPAGVLALAAAAVDDRFTSVKTIGSLASFITETPYEQQRLGVLIPGVVREIGDLSELAALIAPRPLSIAGGVRGGGQMLEEQALIKAYERASRVYSLLSVSDHFQVAK